MSQSIYGIDLATNSFSIHGEDEQGKVLFHKIITRSKALSIFNSGKPRLGRIIQKAISTSEHYWFMVPEPRNVTRPFEQCVM